MMLQLHPSIPLWHLPTAQACQAVALIDYSAEHDLLWVVIRQDGEIWTVPNKELRGQHNATLGRREQPDARTGFCTGFFEGSKNPVQEVACLGG